jgi:predicted phosphodiesterase
LIDDFKIAVVSDTHLGNKYQQLESLEDFYLLAESKGCEVVLHCGDLVDGVQTQPNHLRLFNSPDALVSYTIDNYPETSLDTLYIGGNHESKVFEEFGIDLSDEISKGRRDMIHLGPEEGLVTLNGLKVFLYHGNGSKLASLHMANAYARSIEVDPTPKSAVLCGHLHQYKETRIDGTLVVNVPSFQGTAPYMRAKSVIGGLTILLGEDRTPSLESFLYKELQV